jgi:hypothetical protein
MQHVESIKAKTGMAHLPYLLCNTLDEFLSMGKRFFSSSLCPDWLGSPPSRLGNVYPGCFQGLMPLLSHMPLQCGA